MKRIQLILILVLSVFTSQKSMAVETSDFDNYFLEDFEWWLAPDDDPTKYDLMWNYYSNGQWNSFNDPWHYNGDIPLMDIAENEHYLPEKGWVLIHQEFGLVRSSADDNSADAVPVDNPWFALYNKYTSVLRFYVYTATPPATLSSGGALTLSFEAGQETTSLYQGDMNGQHSGGEDIDPLAHQRLHRIVPKDDMVQNSWLFFDFNMNYDYGLGRTISGSRVRARFNYVMEYDVDLVTESTSAEYSNQESAFDPHHDFYTITEGDVQAHGQSMETVEPSGIFRNMASPEEIMKVGKETQTNFNAFLDKSNLRNWKVFKWIKVPSDFDQPASDFEDLTNDVFDIVKTALPVVRSVQKIGSMIGLWSKKDSDDAPEATITQVVTHGSITGTISMQVNGFSNFLVLPGSMNWGSNTNQQPYYNSPLGLVSMTETPELNAQEFDYEFEQKAYETYQGYPKFVYNEKHNLSLTSFEVSSETPIDINLNGCVVPDAEVKFALVAEIPSTLPVTYNAQHVFNGSSVYLKINETKTWNTLQPDIAITPYADINEGQDDELQELLTFNIKNPFSRFLELGHYHISGFEEVTENLEISTVYVPAEQVGSLTLNIPSNYENIKLRMAANFTDSEGKERMVIKDFSVKLNESSTSIKERHVRHPDFYYTGGWPHLDWHYSGSTYTLDEYKNYPYQNTQDKPSVFFQEHTFNNEIVLSGETELFQAYDGVLLEPLNSAQSIDFQPGSDVTVGLSLDYIQEFNNWNDIYSLNITHSGGDCQDQNPDAYRMGSKVAHHASQFEVFPNPVVSGQTVSFGQVLESVSILNATGMEVLTGENIDQISTASLVPGIYIAKTGESNTSFVVN